MPIRTGSASTSGEGNFDSTMTEDEHPASSTPAMSADHGIVLRIREKIGMIPILRPARSVA
jgi:hypothetical protein